MKKTELNGYVYNFSVDYDENSAATILYIHKYLMIKNEIVRNIYICKVGVHFSNDAFKL